MSVIWTAAEAAAATGGKVQGEWAATGLSIDTRTIEPGEMFVALTAARDGHDFVAAALAKGAAAALVSKVPDGVAAGANLLIVEDVLQGLEALARAARARTQAKVIAITGSVGKTSTKDMAKHVLAGQGRVHAAEKSYNNHWGVPLTLARMPREADFAVIEIGMNHPGEIAPLAALARPDVAIVTTVGPVHLEAFADGIAGIAREKASIFSGLEPDGVAIWNADLEVSEILADAAGGHKSLSFGTRAGSDWMLSQVNAGPDTVTCAASHAGRQMIYKIGAPGAHFGLNALGILAACDAVGADVARAAMALADWAPPQGRGQRHFVRLDPADASIGVDLIDDAYNANPSSVGAALALLATSQPPKGGRRIAILGDMRELGPTEIKLHQGLADHPAMDEIDEVHCAGKLMGHLHAALSADQRGYCSPDAAHLVKHLRDMIRAGDCVLVKGSLSMNMALLVDGIRNLGQAALKET